MTGTGTSAPYQPPSRPICATADTPSSTARASGSGTTRRCPVATERSQACTANSAVISEPIAAAGIGAPAMWLSPSQVAGSAHAAATAAPSRAQASAQSASVSPASTGDGPSTHSSGSRVPA
nr:hypothetical protein [Pseudonocardia sp.]